MESWQPEFDPSALPSAGSRVLAFADGRVLLTRVGELEVGEAIHIGRLDGEPVFAVRLEGPAPEGAQTLRELLATGPEPLAAAAGRAAQLLEWEATHRFCGREGAVTEPAATELARTCPVCGTTYHPRISPAVIMLVEREGKILLARRANAAWTVYSCLAGFVEAGETLEETVAREVREEAGIEVTDIRYFGSQPWPFPSQLMVGFTAVHAGGELHIDETELGDAQWFDVSDLPDIPPSFTIARRLIDAAVARLGG